MITGQLKSKIDKLWEHFWNGGISNPLTVVEQISYLMFLRMLSMTDERDEKRARRTGEEFISTFPKDKQHLRWKELMGIGQGDELLAVVRDELFPFFKTDIIGEKSIGKYLHNAQFMIQDGSLLIKAIESIDKLPLEQGDTKGDLYEYLLSKLSTAGVSGQFRTPRHIIRAMTQIAEPKPTEYICDPACGTSGFLVGAMEYLKETNSTEALIHEEDDGEGNKVKVFPGDLLAPYNDHIFNDMFTGFDFDATMLRIAAMNLLLHGIEHPSIEFQDTLGHSFSEKYPEKSKNYYDLILANPPFKGNIDASNIHSSLKLLVNTKKTELLFLVLIERMLKMGGRCAVIVPDGVLFGASKAHQGIRKMLLDQNRLEAVVSLPSGVFKPYAGVSTAILYFTKDPAGTDNVWFYNVENDGFSLDDKRTPIGGEELTDLVEKFHTRDPKVETKRTKHFFVSADEIRKNKYDLSINRYKEVVYKEVQYDEPPVILERITKLNADVASGLTYLKEMIG